MTPKDLFLIAYVVGVLSSVMVWGYVSKVKGLDPAEGLFVIAFWPLALILCVFFLLPYKFGGWVRSKVND